ncbi:MAG: Uncharacterized protein G01um10147_310 [Microgenomates group bacterium Gr01-1014_7]|nr:MAG: Uncharacterized protein G01um10147_310 [Microgenomates group bacterium Gr01-1014_7]
MKKIEIIWRELLFQATEKGNRQFTQKDLAQIFGFSTSTIFQTLKVPRQMGAVRVTGRNFVVEDPEKLLYHWASVRNLQKDILFTTHVDIPIFEIEGMMPPNVTYGGFSAARKIMGQAAADYDTVYVYAESISDLKMRFTFKKGRTNLVILKADPYISRYGQITTLTQTFVDLWSLPSWQAKDFVNELKEKINGFLS